MSMNNKTETLLSLLDEYKALGIAILKNNKLNYAEYGALLSVSEATIKRRLGELRKAGMIARIGSNKSGYWEVVSLENRKEGKI